MMNNNILLFLQTKDQTMIVYAEENTFLYVIIRVGMVMFGAICSGTIRAAFFVCRSGNLSRSPSPKPLLSATSGLQRQINIFNSIRKAAAEV